MTILLPSYPTTPPSQPHPPLVQHLEGRANGSQVAISMLVGMSSGIGVESLTRDLKSLGQSAKIIIGRN